MVVCDCCLTMLFEDKIVLCLLLNRVVMNLLSTLTVEQNSFQMIVYECCSTIVVEDKIVLCLLFDDVALTE